MEGHDRLEVYRRRNFVAVSYTKDGHETLCIADPEPESLQKTLNNPATPPFSYSCSKDWDPLRRSKSHQVVLYLGTRPVDLWTCGPVDSWTGACKNWWWTHWNNSEAGCTFPATEHQNTCTIRIRTNIGIKDSRKIPPHQLSLSTENGQDSPGFPILTVSTVLDCWILKCPPIAPSLSLIVHHPSSVIHRPNIVPSLNHSPPLSKRPSNPQLSHFVLSLIFYHHLHDYYYFLLRFCIFSFPRHHIS